MRETILLVTIVVLTFLCGGLLGEMVGRSYCQPEKEYHDWRVACLAVGGTIVHNGGFSCMTGSKRKSKG